jgi:hypothetical protein
MALLLLDLCPALPDDILVSKGAKVYDFTDPVHGLRYCLSLQILLLQGTTCCVVNSKLHITKFFKALTLKGVAYIVVLAWELKKKCLRKLFHRR